MSAEESIAALHPELNPSPKEPDNPDARWRKEYEELIRKMGLTEAPAPSTGADRRVYPRVAFPPGVSIYAHGSPREFQMHDLSAGGLCFFSDHYIKAKSRLILSAMGLLALEVDVVGCDMEEVDPNLMDFSYRVRCRFADNVNGFQAFVLAQELFARQ
jgi:hypothetical protein